METAYPTVIKAELQGATGTALAGVDAREWIHSLTHDRTIGPNPRKRARTRFSNPNCNLPMKVKECTLVRVQMRGEHYDVEIPAGAELVVYRKLVRQGDSWKDADTSLILATATVYIARRTTKYTFWLDGRGSMLQL